MAESIINASSYVPKRMRRFGAWNQSRAVPGTIVDLPDAQRSQILDFARETDTLVGLVPSTLGSALTTTARMLSGAVVGQTEIPDAQRAQDFYLSLLAVWINPTGTVFEVGSSTSGLAVWWTSTTNLRAQVSDGTDSATVNMTLPATQESPAEIAFALDVSTFTLRAYLDGVQADTDTAAAIVTPWADSADGQVASINGTAISAVSAPDTLTGMTIGDPGVRFYGNQLPAGF